MGFGVAQGRSFVDLEIPLLMLLLNLSDMKLEACQTKSDLAGK